MKLMQIIACFALMFAMASDPAIAKKDKKNDDSVKKHSEHSVKNKNKSRSADEDSGNTAESGSKAADKDSKSTKDDSDEKTSDSESKKKSSDTKKEEDKAESTKWTREDLESYCAGKEVAGSRSYDGCIDRNQRRIGRPKSQFDMNDIQRGKQE
jgi:hypothetical protein